MRIGLYSAYLPKHKGGGERYLLSIASALQKIGNVELLVPEESLTKMRESLPRYQEIFGIDLERVTVKVSSIGLHRRNIVGVLESRSYDCLFAMTDGSIFPTLCAHSYLIVQVPWTRPLSLSEKIKLGSWKKIIVYSDFVASVLQQHWSIRTPVVIPPYVDTTIFSRMQMPKEKLIVNAGRFFAHGQSNSKRQDVLIEAFIRFLERSGDKKWHLALIGNVDPNADSVRYLDRLREASRGYPISIHTNSSLDALHAFYARAWFYWHAAGFGVDEIMNPENTEHFGITTLEAMACGAIPLVVPKGGQKEVVPLAKLHWQTPEELVDKSLALLQATPQEMETIAQSRDAAIHRYSKDVFTTAIQQLVTHL